MFSSKLWKDKSIFSIPAIKSFCLNIPSTYPAWEINGEMITGLLTPSINDKMAYPKDIIKNLKKNWIIDGENINQIYEAFILKKELFLKKIDQDFNLLTYVIRIPDCISHHPNFRIRKTQENLKKGYIEIDNFIGEILNAHDFDNLILFSDHGLKLYEYEFNIQKILEKQGIMKCNEDFISKILSVGVKIFNFLNPNYFDTTYFHNRFKNIIDRIIKKLGIQLESGKQGKSNRFIHFYSNYGGIYLANSDKSKKLKLVDGLSKHKFVDRIISCTSENMPDILLILKKDFLYSVKSSFFKINHCYSFNHSDKGIFIAFGKNIKKGTKESVNYIDIAPTILDLLKIQKPKYMKGQTLNISR